MQFLAKLVNKYLRFRMLNFFNICYILKLTLLILNKYVDQLIFV